MTSPLKPKKIVLTLYQKSPVHSNPLDFVDICQKIGFVDICSKIGNACKAAGKGMLCPAKTPADRGRNGSCGSRRRSAVGHVVHLTAHAFSWYQFLKVTESLPISSLVLLSYNLNVSFPSFPNRGIGYWNLAVMLEPASHGSPGRISEYRRWARSPRSRGVSAPTVRRH